MGTTASLGIGFAYQLKSSSFFQTTIKLCQKTEGKDGWKFSHNFLCTVPWDGEIDQVEEASLKVQCIPMDNYRNDPNAGYEVYAMLGFTQDMIHQLARDIFRDYAGAEYGSLQLLWFIWRALNNLAHRKVGREKNWIPEGIICSELIYDTMERAWQKYKVMIYKTILESIPFDENTVWPLDNYGLVKAHPETFLLAESKDAFGIRKYTH